MSTKVDGLALWLSPNASPRATLRLQLLLLLPAVLVVVSFAIQACFLDNPKYTADLNVLLERVNSPAIANGTDTEEGKETTKEFEVRVVGAGKRPESPPVADTAADPDVLAQESTTCSCFHSVDGSPGQIVSSWPWFLARHSPLVSECASTSIITSSVR